MQSRLRELDQQMHACEGSLQTQATELNVCHDKLAGQRTALVIENNIQQYFGYLDQHPRPPVHVTKGGKPFLLYDVVFGTISIPAKVELRTDRSVPFVIEFTPQAWVQAQPTQQAIGATAVAWSMHIEEPTFQYATAVYDPKSSDGQSNDRAIDLNRTERWVWQLSPKPDFEEEQWNVGAFLAYSVSGAAKEEKEVARQGVDLVMRPGFLSRVWKIAAENQEIKDTFIAFILALLGIGADPARRLARWIRHKPK